MLKIKKIKPLFNAIVTTMDRYAEDQYTDGGLIKVTAGTIKENQKVIAVGSIVRDIKVGDMVSINPIRYAVKKHQEGSLKDGVICDNPVIAYNFNTIVLDDIEYLYLDDRDINYIIEDYEEVEVETPKIILPDKKVAEA